MAVVNNPQSSTVTLKILSGTNATTGANVYKNLSFSNVKPDATDADVFAIATGLKGLQKGNVVSISRASTGILVNQ